MLEEERGIEVGRRGGWGAGGGDEGERRCEKEKEKMREREREMDRERRREKGHRENVRGRGKDLKRGRQGWRERDKVYKVLGQVIKRVINSPIALTCGAL